MRRPATSREAFAGRFLVPAVIGLVALAAIAAWLLLRPSGGLRVEAIQSGLEHPWDLAFTDDGRMVVTERTGRVLVYASADASAELLSTTVVPDVRAELESGLMGVAVSGDTVFVCASRDPDGDSGDPWRVELLPATIGPDSSLTDFAPIPIGETIGGPRHQGCAVQVADGFLWLSIGDANLAAAANPAQDPAVSSGKILRLELDGSIPPDNPFGVGSPVFSLGHRNPQGLAVRPDGLLLAVEHGTNENDEVNLIEPGGNYGYPCWTGADSAGPWPEGCGPATDYRAPAWASGAPTLATSGAAFLEGTLWGAWEGDLVVTTLKESDLRRFTVADDGTVLFVETLLDGRFGRLRAAVIGPDGALYLTTSNGSDDRILRVVPSA